MIVELEQSEEMSLKEYTELLKTWNYKITKNTKKPREIIFASFIVESEK